MTNTLLITSATDGTVWSINPLDGAVLSKTWITGLTAPRLMCFDLQQQLWVASAGPTAPPVYRFDATGKRLPLQLKGIDVHGIMAVANDSRNRLYITNPLRNLVVRITMSGDVDGGNQSYCHT